VDRTFANRWCEDAGNGQSDPASPAFEEQLSEEFGHQTTRRLTGTNLLEIASRSPNLKDVLLGDEDRYLCRGGGMVIVGPSGAGKSVLGVQMVIEWSCGRSSFGIKPARPLQIMLIQAEDDEGDLIEMGQIINRLDLGEEERELVRRNTHAEFVNDVTGGAFLAALNGFVEQRAFDLIIINPSSLLR
jgi:hypothetical protein